MRPQRSMGPDEKCFRSSKKQEKGYVLLSCRSLDNARALFEKARRAKIRGRFWSIDAHAGSPISFPQDSSSTSPSPARLRSDDTHAEASGDRGGPPKITNKQKKGSNNQATRSRLRDLPRWLQEFANHLRDTEVPTLANMTRIRKIFRKWQPGITVLKVTTQKTEIARPGEVVPGAENFGDLMPEDHKVLFREDASRNNHRHAVVVQDLTTQWIQSYPCKTIASQETERSLRKFFVPWEKPRVIYRDNSLEFGKFCETYHGITLLQHSIDARRMAQLKERYAEQRKGRLLRCCNEAWMKNGGLILWTAIAFCEMSRPPGRREKPPFERRFGEPF